MVKKRRVGDPEVCDLDTGINGAGESKGLLSVLHTG